MGWSTFLEFSQWFLEHCSCPSQSVLIRCTKRTPRSNMRRASRHIRPNFRLFSWSSPYRRRMCSGSPERSTNSGAAVCIRNANS